MKADKRKKYKFLAGLLFVLLMFIVPLCIASFTSDAPDEKLTISVLNTSEQTLRNLYIISTDTTHTVGQLLPGASRVLTLCVNEPGGGSVGLYDAERKSNYVVHQYFEGTLVGRVDVEIDGVVQGALTGEVRPQTQWSNKPYKLRVLDDWGDAGQ